MESETQTLVIGGSMASAAVGVVIWVIKALVSRQIQQMDEGFSHLERQVSELKAEFSQKIDSLAAEVYRNTAQTTGLAVEVGGIKQRVETHDGKFDGLQTWWRAEFQGQTSQIQKLNDLITSLMVRNGRDSK